MKESRSSKRDKESVFVEVPEPMTYLDTATMPQILTAVGIALFAKLLMMVNFSVFYHLIIYREPHLLVCSKVNKFCCF